jgi:hypothetical protein
VSGIGQNKTHQVIENTSKYVKSWKMTTEWPKTVLPDEHQTLGAGYTLIDGGGKYRAFVLVLSFCFNGTAW